MSSVREYLVYSTVRIHTKRNIGEADATGTLCYFHYHNINHYFLVTNKHVIEGAKTGTLFFTKATTPFLDQQGNTTMVPYTGQIEEVTFDNFEQHFTVHPNPDIDLAMLPLNDILYNRNIFLGGALNLAHIPKFEQMTYPAGEQILAIGYPHNIFDKVNNLPIVRNGITATPPKFDYDGKKEFLIDASVHHGLSGAPVFLFSQSLHNRFEKIESSEFIGIISGGMERDAAGRFVAEEKTSVTASTRTSIPINLGVVIKSSCLLDFRQLAIAKGTPAPQLFANNTPSNLPPHIINLFNRELSTSFELPQESYLLITALRDYLESRDEEPYYDQVERAISAIKYSNYSHTFKKALEKFNGDLDPKQVATLAVKELYDNYPMCFILYLQNAYPVKNFITLIEKEFKLRKP